MSSLLEFALLCFTSLFTMINPVGVIPVYMTLVEKLDADSARRVVYKAILTSVITLVLFALAGNAVFHFFSIRIENLRVVGGILFFLLGYDMLNVRMDRPRRDDESLNEFVEDVAISPLAIPFICGPGAITMSILLFDESGTTPRRAVFFISLLGVLMVTGGILLAGRRIIRVLGPSGTKVMMRIMGLIVMMIAVEFFFSGLTPIVREMLG